MLLVRQFRSSGSNKADPTWLLYNMRERVIFQGDEWFNLSCPCPCLFILHLFLYVHLLVSLVYWSNHHICYHCYINPPSCLCYIFSLSSSVAGKHKFDHHQISGQYHLRQLPGKRLWFYHYDLFPDICIMFPPLDTDSDQFLSVQKLHDFICGHQDYFRVTHS